MRTSQLLLTLTAPALLAGCFPPPVHAPGLRPEEAIFANPDPRIEALHVKAYNYDLGIGVKQNRKLANKLYLQAARAGEPRSMMNYAINRFGGVGVAADPVDAYYWIDKARFATQFSRDTKVKWRIRGVQDRMRRAMTPSQVKEAISRRRR